MWLSTSGIYSKSKAALCDSDDDKEETFSVGDKNDLTVHNFHSDVKIEPYAPEEVLSDAKDFEPVVIVIETQQESSAAVKLEANGAIWEVIDDMSAETGNGMSSTPQKTVASLPKTSALVTHSKIYSRSVTYDPSSVLVNGTGKYQVKPKIGATKKAGIRRTASKAPSHSRNTCSKRSLTCTECGKSFPCKSMLVRHRDFHNKDKPYACDICGATFKYSKNVTAHKVYHTENYSFRCQICGRGFYSKGNYSYHAERCGKKLPSGLLRCPECGKEFRSKSLLIRHQDIHNNDKPHLCDECGCGFKHKRNLIMHKRYHTKKNLCPCPECGKVFLTKGNLECHMQTHTHVKPFTCEICGKGLSANAYLIGHMRIHSGDKPFKCDECGKFFNTKSTLRVHRKFHSDQRPYVCDVCGMGFKVGTHLNRHKKLHGRELFTCTTCDKSFIKESRLEKHQRVHEH